MSALVTFGRSSRTIDAEISAAASRPSGTDRPTLSTVLRGRMESVTIDRLAAWRTTLGRTGEIHVRPYDRRMTTGQLVMTP